MLPVGGWCTAIRLRYRTVSLFGLRIGMYVYMYWETMFSCNCLVIYFQRKNYLVMIILLFKTVRVLFLEQNYFIMTLILFICFVLTSIWKWHDLLVYSIYGIEETTPAEKTSIILFPIKEKQLSFEFFVCLFIVVKEMTTSWSTNTRV